MQSDNLQAMMGSKSQRLNQRLWLWVALWVSIFTVLAVLGAVGSYVAQMVYDKPVSWGLAFRRSFKEWFAYGLVTIGVFWFCGRLRLEPGRAWRWALLHWGAAIVFSMAYVTLLSGLIAGEISVQTGQVLTFSFLFQKMAIHTTCMNLVLYWIVVFGHLGWQYYLRFRERELQAAALATELIRARLDVLRMQLNPHFLFNTLHTISALVHENPEAADRIVARLSDLLRVSLEQTDVHEVPLQQELAFLERYLEIEQMRFEDRLMVEKEIEPGLEKMLVPSLILQPLVENSIRHGIESREDRGRIKIRVRRVEDQLELGVSDDGPGLPETETEPRREGVGLSNTRSRLAHLYGAAHQFELTNGAGAGLEVRLRIPCREEARPCQPQVLVVSATQESLRPR